MQALKVMVQMDSLNLKEEYIRQMNQPKRIHVTHSKLSDEELMKMIEEKAKEIGLSLSEFPIEALPHLKERMLEGSIK